MLTIIIACIVIANSNGFWDAITNLILTVIVVRIIGALESKVDYGK